MLRDDSRNHSDESAWLEKIFTSTSCLIIAHKIARGVLSYAMIFVAVRRGEIHFAPIPNRVGASH